jgi:hypothetical protein
MARFVWLFTRPLSAADVVPLLESVSNGKSHLCHWGVLVTDITKPDLNALLLRNKQVTGIEKTELGIMYELFRLETTQNVVNITRPFTVSTLRALWHVYSAMYIGATEMPHNAIEREGDHCSLITDISDTYNSDPS